MGGIHRWPVDSPNKGPAMRKAFPCYGSIMWAAYWGWTYSNDGGRWMVKPQTRPGDPTCSPIELNTDLNLWLFKAGNLKAHARKPRSVEPRYNFHTMMTPSNGNIFQRYWPFVRGIHRSSVNSPHKDQWGGALMFSLICAWINGWVSNREVGDLSRNRAHY